MRRWMVRLTVLLLTSYLLVNSSWIYAAGYSLSAEPCDPQLVSEARLRLDSLFGEIESEPVWACTTARNNWLGAQYGQTNFAPGLPAIIRIGPKGMNVDVIAHEWTHAELFHRIGFVARELHVPVWFDEGLAMQVDHRSDYDQEALVVYQSSLELVLPDRSLLDTAQFFQPGYQGKYHYALSRCLVSDWLESVIDPRAVLTKLSRDVFDLIYDAGNEACKPRSSSLSGQYL